MKVPPGSTIYRQGELGGVFYVILRGTVKVVMKKPDFGPEPLTITTLYDGDNFGELAVFKTKHTEDLPPEVIDEISRRRATCIVRPSE